MTARERASGAVTNHERKLATLRASLPRSAHCAAQLKILALRTLELADQVAAGQLGFIDAVDLAYSAAVWAGLNESIGEEIVQLTLAAGFANARMPAR